MECSMAEVRMRIQHGCWLQLASLIISVTVGVSMHKPQTGALADKAFSFRTTVLRKKETELLYVNHEPAY